MVVGKIATEQNENAYRRYLQKNGLYREWANKNISRGPMTFYL